MKITKLRHPLTGDWGISSKSVVPNSPVSEVTLYEYLLLLFTKIGIQNGKY